MKDKLNIAVVGYGGRGNGITKYELLKMDDVNVTAVCDVYEDRMRQAVADVEEARGTTPFSCTDYHDLLNRDDVDAVFVYTAWEPHIEIACAAMEAGKSAAIEVGGAYSVEDCWKLVDTVERTGMQFMFLENCCYDDWELAITNMARAGLFGEIVHCKGGYKHDLRDEITFGEQNRHYRLRNYIGRNCENYPTHELGPICKLLRINDGNRMVKLSSFSSKSRGLHAFVEKTQPTNEKLLNTTFKQGDVVNTVITCANGETILLTLDTSLPRSYCRDFTVEGTKGMYSEESRALYLEFEKQDENGKTVLDGQFRNAEEYKNKYASPLWADREQLLTHGHGGMDALTLRACVNCFKDGSYPPIDVYDAVAFMCITALSEISIANGNMPVDIPDFTRGRWMKREHKAVGPFALDVQD